MKVNNRRRSKLSKRASAAVALVVALVITVGLAFLGLNGMNLTPDGEWKLLPWLPTTDAEKWPAALSLGLDLRGGMYVEYEATMTEEMQEQGIHFETQLQATMDTIQRRLSDKASEATVTRLGSSGIRVEIPDVTDPAAVLELIGTPAKLEFLDPDGNVFMDGTYLQSAYRSVDEKGKPCIAFVLNKEGAQIFGDMTAAHEDEVITITLDCEILMAPTVEDPIYGGQVQISGDFTEEDCNTIALQLQSGSLPLDLRQDKLDTISATLGDNALSSSVKAALIGIAIVMLIMIIRYRLCGLVADWALCLYIIILFLLLAVVPSIQLTLPGIAGIILGIGMAVDANVVIFERIKEESIAGRPMIHAVRIGFKNAMSAIIDANITTIIAAFVLMIFGTGSVQGFAVTLLLSVVTSMLSAILITRFLLVRMVRVWKNPALYVPHVKPAAETVNEEAK